MCTPNYYRKLLLFLDKILPVIALVSACNPPQATSIQIPTHTLQPTYTPFPTYTPLSTYTPFPTYTPLPTYTLPNTPTSLKTIAPAETPTPTADLLETIAAAEYQNCNDSTGPRQKVRVENTTGDTASLYLYGPENYLCSIPPGISQIYVVNGDYALSALMCGSQLYNFGRHIINPTWVITLKCP